LLLASNNGSPAMVDLLLTAGADPNLANFLGTTPLMRVAAAGSVECVTLLLNYGADVNRKETSRGQTALMFAAAANRADVIRTLAAHGADLNLTSKAIANTTDLTDEDGNPIPAASRTGATKQQTKGDGQSKGMGGRTALHYASREGHRNAVIALVEAGADINKADPLDGSTALIVAISNGHFDVADYLVEHGANPNLAMADGLAALYATLETQWAPVSWTPNAFTAANGIVEQATSYVDLMRVLLAHGADPNAKITKTLWFSPPHHNISWVKAAGATPFWRRLRLTISRPCSFCSRPAPIRPSCPMTKQRRLRWLLASVGPEISQPTSPIPSCLRCAISSKRSSST
jgi:ankyrin repeat protein